MKSLSIVGLQWGDEGKGKIVDALSASFEYVVRWNGGHNAGHTVVVNGKKFPLSLVPSGVLQKKKLLIAQGVVINPSVLLSEIAMLENAGYAVDLMIDPRCHIVMPYHQLLDKATELWKGKNATGSLHLGIGYCYEDRNNRAGIRLEHLIRPKIFKKLLTKIIPLKKNIIEKAYGMKADLSVTNIYHEYVSLGRKLQQYMGDVSSLITDNITTHRILFEQAHGTMLDPVFGTYPYTVAPPTISPALFGSVGLRNQPIDVLGVVKAYTTRVGNGPFPTEISNKTGELIRINGNEYGTVSKRPRRCGWLDLPMLRYAVRLNGCTMLAVTKLDVLRGLLHIKICTAYRCQGRLLSEFPAEISLLPYCTPVYTTLIGWKEDISTSKQTKDLPMNARAYLLYLEKELGIPVRYVSVGAERNAIIQF